MLYKAGIQTIYLHSADSGPCITWWFLTVTLLCVVDNVINSDLSPSFIAANKLSHLSFHISHQNDLESAAAANSE